MPCSPLSVFKCTQRAHIVNHIQDFFLRAVILSTEPYIPEIRVGLIVRTHACVRVTWRKHARAGETESFCVRMPVCLGSASDVRPLFVSLTILSTTCISVS